MSTRNIIAQLLSFIIYITVQVVFLRNEMLLGTAFCYLYISCIILLPLEIDKVLSLLLAFLLGFITDLFYDTLGIHIAACVFMAYARVVVLNVMSPSGGYEPNMQPTIKIMGLQWFLTYSLILVFVHHITLFLIEASNLSLLLNTLTRTVTSTFYTLFIIIVLQYIFYSSPKKSSI